jgi:photosystem II stability/assembly factor-like uncharacterized protein
MIQIYLAFHGALAVLRQRNGQWIAELTMADYDCQCLAIDPHRPQRVYCGTFTAGLWVTDNAGASWQLVPAELPQAAIMSIAVSPLEKTGGGGVVWAGTEPSALFRSEDGGHTWQERPNLQELPSKPTWSFPPRPWTHHVRWIEPDANVADRIFVGIELGGVMRSLDGGLTWEDRKPGSQYDCHTLRTHKLAPGVVYEAAGGGFAESHDSGDTWRGHDEGRRHHYLWGLAVDPGDPETLIVSGSPGPRSAHSDQNAEATLYRRSHGGSWQPVQEGLPDPIGTRAYVLATHPAEPGVFYAATRRDLYRSADAGQRWEKLSIAWPAQARFNTVNAMAVCAM